MEKSWGGELSYSVTWGSSAYVSTVVVRGLQPLTSFRWAASGSDGLLNRRVLLMPVVSPSVCCLHCNHERSCSGDGGTGDSCGNIRALVQLLYANKACIPPSWAT